MNQIDYYKNNISYTNIINKHGKKELGKYVEEIEKHLTSNERFLDVGCGTGNAINIIGARSNIFGIDISTSSVEIAKNKGIKNINVYNGNVIPFDDRYFDIVGSFNVLEHVESVDGFLSEQFRVLKKGGYLIVVCPNFLSITNNYHHHTKGLRRKLLNLMKIFSKLFSQKYMFEKMDIITRDAFQPDDDACNVTNPIDILKWSRKYKLDLVYWSSCSEKCIGLKKHIDFYPIKIILGSSFMVFNKLENIKNE